MTSERWEQIKTIVGEAIDMSPPDRKRFVEEACGNDSSLRREVESLLASADAPDSLPDARAAIASIARDMMSARDRSVEELIETGLGTQYEIQRPLGRGGMGQVFLARERALERLVAIKVLRPELAMTDDSAERFHREARLAARVSHPGIVGLHAFGEVGGMWYLVMAYVPGATLAERIRESGPLAVDEVHRILLELADALDWAHRHGVVHCDIKPANILLEEESGRAVLADFGISKSLDGPDVTASSGIMGTPDFMAPEQAVGGAIDERSDLYAIGAVGYAMLTGVAPRRTSEGLPPLRTTAPTVAAELAGVIERCLALDPRQRWADARALRDALEWASPGEKMAEPLRQMRSFAPYALAWAVVWSMLALLTRRSVDERVLLLIIAALVPIGLVLHMLSSGGREHSVGHLLRAAAWPPEWWSLWWPRALRRPADLWSRLPWWPVRLVREVVGLFFVGVPAIIGIRQGIGPTDPVARDSTLHAVLDASQWALLLGTATAVVVGFAWAQSRRFTVAETTRLFFGGTLPSAFWRSERVRNLLKGLGA
jgi:tRNA A-37 threonylcarbamoyl transferase component Bud32